MPSFLARFRTRAVSQSTTSGSARSAASPATATTSASSPDLMTPPATYVLQPSMDRKIIPDMAQLMDSYASEDSDTGLKPPRARKRATLLKDVDAVIFDNDRASKQSLKSVGKENVAVISGSGSSPSNASATSSKKQRSSRLARQLSSVSPWSTFGRHRSQESHLSAQRDKFVPTGRNSHVSSIDSTARRSRKSKRSDHDPAFGSLTSIDKRPSTSHSSDGFYVQTPLSTPGKKTSSKPDNGVHVEDTSLATRSPNDSLRSTRSRSLTTRSSHSIHSQHVYTSTPVSHNQALALDSPHHTFGNPSPGSSHSRSRSSAQHSTQASPPPPLPPLNHPAFESRVYSRSQEHTQNLSDRKSWSTQEHGQTFPPRQFRTAGGGAHASSVPFPPAQLTFGRHVRLRAHSSLPRVQHVFRSPSLEGTDAPPNRRRSRSESSRRSSAEWSAHQAVAGVASPRPSEFGWPAEVAHQMLAMSLGPPVGDTGRVPAGGTARANRVVAVNRWSESTLPCSQVPSHLIPPPLQPPVSIESRNPFEAVERDGGRHLSWPRKRLPSAKFKRQHTSEQGHRRMQERDVAIDASDKATGGPGEEHPNGIAPISGAPRSLHESSADPTASTSQAMVSVPSSQSPSSAPFPSPPAQKLSHWRPNRSASEPGLQSVPETPAQKKGKRKAEEVDITPPDHKQHTTFVLPQTHRSPRRLRISFRPLLQVPPNRQHTIVYLRHIPAHGTVALVEQAA
ncbi:hypothetical protein OBBRIDRAFT_597162 [Obba rivulosa]|uniref:Uncharacterized protein n=1 Tax=Obba rivulosa TaxID=1052685 RepID=A0A8E2DJH4_9APHY|nr:hypothetical protein OBBRIDRAFT_597162 [Obba rivulosa]